MSDDNTDTADTKTTTRDRRRKRGLIFGFIAAALLGALVLVPAAIAGGRAMGHFGPGHCWKGDGEISQEVVRDRMGFAADRALSRVDATDEQVAQVDAVLDGLAPALFEQGQEGRDLHEELAAALTAQEVDEEELERLRLEFLAHLDEGSAIVHSALVDVADILTPEQRVELLEIGRKLHGGR